VVDASALAAVLFGEPRAKEIAARLGERELLAPTLLPYELASVGLKKLERYRSQRVEILESLALFARLGIREVEVPPEALVELARSRSLSTYDAAYLWLARTLACELVTLDRELAEAAAAPGPDPAS
jgi:predicted nucleic acid-binding protein